MTMDGDPEKQPPAQDAGQSRRWQGKRRDFLQGAAAGAGATVLAGGLGVAAASHWGADAAIKPVGFSRARPITSDPILPKKVDVVVIGGGFIGTSTALALAERGISVALFEKGVVAGESSGRSGGMVQALFEDSEKLDLIELSKQRWRKMRELTGEECGYKDEPDYVLFEKDEDLGFANGWLEGTRGLPNAGARMVSAREAAAMAPGATVKFAGGIVCPEDGTAEPELAAPGFALGARKHGATIHQFCAVRGIERTAGRVSAVITERGRVETSNVVMATGVWSTMMGADLGLDVPIIQCFAKAMSLAPFNGPPHQVAIMGQELPLGWRKQMDGGYIVYEFFGIAPVLPESIRHFLDLIPAMKAQADALNPRFNWDTFWRWMPRWNPVPLDRPGPYEATRIYEPEPAIAVADRGFVHLQQVMPAFRHTQVRERWGGAMQMAVDNLPILSAVESIPGLFIGTGHLFGLTQGPGSGVVLADLVTGAMPPIDVGRFRFSRFTDGGKLRYHA